MPVLLSFVVGFLQLSSVPLSSWARGEGTPGANFFALHPFSSGTSLSVPRLVHHVNRPTRFAVVENPSPVRKNIVQIGVASRTTAVLQHRPRLPDVREPPTGTPMNDSLRDLLSGRRRGITPAVARTALGLAAIGYGFGAGWRNRRYDRGVGVNRADVPVISVGNLTAGGTGKTPVVAMLANHFRRWGVNVTLLSRGYRSLEADGHEATNDEARVLERLCPGVPHLQQPDRVAAAGEAVAQHHAELLILDDGFQHRRLARDLDIVLIDATNPFGYGRLLPRGLLREPIAALRRADLVLLTRADAATLEAKSSILETIHGVVPRLPVVEVAFPPTGLVNPSGQRQPLERLDETPTLAFCGIGNPAGFEKTLAAAGLHPAGVIAFADHHHYRPADLFRLSQRADALGAGAAVTTLKDLVKLRSDVLPGPTRIPIWAVETGCEIVTNGSALFDRLAAFVGRVASRAA